MWDGFASQETLVLSEDIFSCHNWWWGVGGRVIGCWPLWVEAKNAKHTKMHSSTAKQRLTWLKSIRVLRSRNPDLD